MVTILYFAGARTSLNISQETIHFTGTLSSLIQELEKRYGDNEEFIAILKRSAWSVNEEMVMDDVILNEFDIVGVIPPVSGGQAPVSYRRADTRQYKKQPIRSSSNFKNV